VNAPTWRERLASLEVPAGDEAAAIGELELAKAKLIARLNGKPEATKPAPEPDRLLTVAEVAKRMGVSKRHVYEHARSWPFTRKLGPGTLRFSSRGLDRHLARTAPVG
jgi:excisionase family DNA binding protein